MSFALCAALVSAAAIVPAAPAAAQICEGNRNADRSSVLEAALPDAMGAHESAMLNWLGKEWGIALRIEESASGDGA